jgi:competence protein ComEC
MSQELVEPLVIEAEAKSSPRWIPEPPFTAMRAIPQGEETQLTLWITAVRDGRSWRPASGWAILNIDGVVTDLRAGDRLRIMAQASRPAAPLNPGEFNLAANQRAYRTLARMRAEFPESVTLAERGPWWSPRMWLSYVRLRGTALLRRSISPQRVTLASALLLGTREQLDPHRNENYLVTGSIHILSISGLHVGILAAGFWLALRSGLLPRRPALVAAMVLTILYALLTDMQPPVVRATVLVVVLCLARLANRQALGFNALGAAALVVLAYQPASLFLAGTQLSFLAVAVMILFAPLLLPQPITDPLDRLIAATRPWPVRGTKAAVGVVWRLWLTGALIWAISLPIVWHQYNLISPVALVINTLVWIPITLALYAGFGALLIGWAIPPLGSVCGALCDWNLHWMEAWIARSRGWPGSYFWCPAPPTWWVAVFYVTLGLLAVFPVLRPARRWWFVLPVMWFGAALVLASPAAKSGLRERPLTCSFVAVGHGVAGLIRTILYDGGRLGSPLAAARPISTVLWSRGITHLDAIIVSHADSDHFNGIPDLLERFSVGVVYVSPVMFEDAQPAVMELRSALIRAGVSIREIHSGDRLASSPEVRLEVLHPPRRGIIGSDNANSIVLLVEHAGRRLLLTGDLEPPGMEDLLAEEPLDCDVILAPHHGSRRSDPTGFALWSTPERAIISGSRSLGDIPDIESVKDSYRARGCEVFHTAEDGCVRIELSAGGVKAAAFRLR